MALNIDQFNERIRAMQFALEEELPDINQRIAADAIALVNLRIVERGVDADGASLGDYSMSQVPAFFYYGKAINASAEAYRKKKAKDKEGISYEEWRAANGLQTNHVDLQFTGSMWRDIGVIRVLGKKGETLAVVGAMDKTTRTTKRGSLPTSDLTEYLGDRYGNFLELSKEEIEIISEALDDELQKIADQYLS